MKRLALLLVFVASPCFAGSKENSALIYVGKTHNPDGTIDTEWAGRARQKLRDKGFFVKVKSKNYWLIKWSKMPLKNAKEQLDKICMELGIIARFRDHEQENESFSKFCFECGCLCVQTFASKKSAVILNAKSLGFQIAESNDIETYDLIIMDMTWPNAMSYEEFYAKFKELVDDDLVLSYYAKAASGAKKEEPEIDYDAP